MMSTLKMLGIVAMLLAAPVGATDAAATLETRIAIQDGDRMVATPVIRSVAGRSVTMSRSGAGAYKLQVTAAVVDGGRAKLDAELWYGAPDGSWTKVASPQLQMPVGVTVHYILNGDRRPAPGKGADLRFSASVQPAV